MRVANRSLFDIESISFKKLTDFYREISFGGFYQQWEWRLTRDSAYTLSQHLILMADHAYGCRRLEIAEQVGELLTMLPLPNQCQYIGSYYHALRLKRAGQVEEATKQLVEIAEKGPLPFRARALSTLGAIVQGVNFEASLSLRREALQIALHNQCDPLICIESQRALAIYKSTTGDNHGALADLKKLYPLVRHFHSQYPFLLPDLANSIGVTLLELGQSKEASKFSAVALASSYASAYPEWRQTGLEIKQSQEMRTNPRIFINKKIIAGDNVLYQSYEPYSNEGSLLVGAQDVGSAVSLMPRRFDMETNKEDSSATPSIPREEDAREDIQSEIMNHVLNKKTPVSDLDQIVEFIRKLKSN